MTALVYEMRRAVSRLECSSCGAEANASCDCGKPYMPAKVRAAEAIAANPQKSDRAIAADLGIGNATVSRARREAGVSDDTPRIGKDGKSYPVTRREPDDDEPGDTAEEIWNRGLRHRAGEAIAGATFSNWQHQYGDYLKFQITSELVTLAEQASEAWGQLANHLRELK